MKSNSPLLLYFFLQRRGLVTFSLSTVACEAGVLLQVLFSEPYCCDTVGASSLLCKDDVGHAVAMHSLY